MIFPFLPSSVVLVASNAIPLLGVFFLDWRVFDILALFWLENIAVGVINVLRMTTVLVKKGDMEALFTIPFFCVHYGIFVFVHGVFIVSLFGKSVGIADQKSLSLSGLVDVIFTQESLAWGAAGLFLSHLFSFFVNFIGRKECESATIKKLMAAPYGRIVILHLTILAGGAFVMATGSALWALVLLVLIKTGIDLAAHVKEHAPTGGISE